MGTLEQLQDLDLRVGTVIGAAPHPSARNPAIQLQIDFGELGVKQTSAQITTHYDPQTLKGRQVVAVTNIGSRRIAGFTSEVLVLGAVLPNDEGVILLRPDWDVPNGCPIA